MIVPRYWAEARVKHYTQEGELPIRRFGWSNVSVEEAQVQAEARAAEALERIRSGEDPGRWEPRVAYNGADGVPIREEILEVHGETIITRNTYGARCLNTPNVLFADVDEAREFPAMGCFLTGLAILVAGCWLGWQSGTWKRGLAFTIVTGLVALLFSPLIAAGVQRLCEAVRGGREAMLRRGIARFRRGRPHWRIRLYSTPAGFRLLVTHALFDPRGEEVAGFFKAIGTDRRYAAMCRAQNCFRARLTGKPWRMGMTQSLRPRRGVWPVKPEYMEEREVWLREYESAAAGFAACRFIDESGDGAGNETALAVQRLHDEVCRAESGLPVA